MFQAGDTVLYSTDGVCVITGIVEKTLRGEVRRYYELRPLYRRETQLYLPLDNEKATSKLRKVLTEEEIYSAIHAMPDEASIWIENNTERKETYQRIIKSGDHRAIIRLIKTLYEHRRSLSDCGRKLHITDDTFLREAEKVLYEEFSHVLHISREQVLPFIQEEIGAGSR